MLYIVADGRHGQLSYARALARLLVAAFYPALRRLKQQELLRFEVGTRDICRTAFSRRYKN
jgi:hypothetical protein